MQHGVIEVELVLYSGSGNVFHDLNAHRQFLLRLLGSTEGLWPLFECDVMHIFETALPVHATSRYSPRYKVSYAGQLRERHRVGSISSYEDTGAMSVLMQNQHVWKQNDRVRSHSGSRQYVLIFYRSP